MKPPNFAEALKWLRRYHAPAQTIPDDYLRGYWHALDDTYRWLVWGGTPPTPPQR